MSYCPHWSCTLAEVDQGHKLATAEGQATLFRATGFNGVSEPDDSDDVDEGDILEELVVKPSGIPTPLELEVAAARLALVSTSDDGGIAFCCAAAKLAPIVL